MIGVRTINDGGVGWCAKFHRLHTTPASDDVGASRAVSISV